MEREIVGSRAFNIENERIYTDEEMRKDIVSYLSEYRLRVQKYDYELAFSFTPEEGFLVRDIHRGEAMRTKAQRTIAERTIKGLPIHREIAELAGIENLDEQLVYAKVGDPVFWLSPPGPKEQGYGDYGFLYEGQITRVTPQEKHIVMTAIRIENPTLGQSNDALSTLGGIQLEYTSAEDFLANPHVKQGGDLLDVDFTLHQFFSFTMDKEEERINKRVISDMDYMINEFIVVIRTGTREEKVRAFYALENYAFKLKERYKKKQDIYKEPFAGDRSYQYLVDIVSVYGFRPPMVAGSCGPTGEETRSNDIFASYKDLMKAIFGDLFKSLGLEEDEWFKCPSCHYKATGPIGNMCPGCHLTKEAYAQNSGQPVCD